MITIIKCIGFFLLLLVGYHYINKPLGLSLAGSIAIAIFALCLMSIYQTYRADRKNWLGWGLIASGCLLLATFVSFNLLLLLPGLLIIAGYRLAELPFPGITGGSGDAGGLGGCGDISGSGCDGGD